jgi:hypothetical protein
MTLQNKGGTFLSKLEAVLSLRYEMGAEEKGDEDYRNRT